MSDTATGDERPSDVAELVEPSDPVERVEGYDTDDGVVLYDAHNPLAWVKSTVSTTLEAQR